ncbi:radical SAM protein [Clostridioides difficile]|nr:radical SAM protein [Clostridioides difficile]MCZ1114103.1 radical SAM protein [Clostridioides difficile]MDI6393632.1 radical SAM protein [Clostridioides difficile]
MAKFNEKLLEGIQPQKAFFTDGYGQVFDAKSYVEYCYTMVNAKQEAQLVPTLYNNPIGVQFELLYKCNQRCIHCYNQSGEENNNNDTGLTLAEWKDIARKVGEMGIFQCVISGGEPLLMGDGLFEIMDILHDYGVTFIVITNGMLLTEKNIHKFKKYRYNWFQISIDGSKAETHDYIRGAKSFEKAINAANLVKEAGLPLVIAHAVMKKNKNDVAEMIDLAYLLGATRIVTGPFSYMGRAILNSEDVELTEDEIMEVYNIVDNKANEYSGKFEVSMPIEEVVSLRAKLAEPNGVLLIRPNGDVKFDCVSPFKLGNLKEDSLDEIWEKGKRVYSHPRLIEYVSQIKSHHDLLTTKPFINVDPDELLVFEEETK